MGWFSSSSSSSSSSSTSTPASSSNNSGIAPNRTQRSACWEARDAFFQCLDRNNIIDPVKDSVLASKACGREDDVFESECVASWVGYFKKRRVMEYKKNQMIAKLAKEGAEKVELPMPAAPAPGPK